MESFNFRNFLWKPRGSKKQQQQRKNLQGFKIQEKTGKLIKTQFVQLQIIPV